MSEEKPFEPRMVQLTHPDESPRWYFAQSIDLERWLPAITNHPGDGQENDGALVAAFDQECGPSLRHGKLLAASHEMFMLLRRGLPLLHKAAAESEDKELLALCAQVKERIEEIEATPQDPTVKSSWNPW